MCDDCGADDTTRCDDGGADDLLRRMTQHSWDDNFVDDDFQSMTLREAVIAKRHPQRSSRGVIKKTRFFVDLAYICPQFKRKIQKTMNITQIQDLIKFVAKSGVSEVEIEQKDFKITIKTPGKGKQEFIQVASAPMMTAPAQMAMPAAAPAPAASAPAPVASNLIEIKSPMIGTFYRSASPDKPAFVEVGSEIHVGDKVCIVEAMKLFNEIESEVSGRIVKILVNDMSPIEFDQPLFLVEPA